eukprot:30385-Pelagococcus_subviridis.AAC.9
MSRSVVIALSHRERRRVSSSRGDLAPHPLAVRRRGDSDVSTPPPVVRGTRQGSHARTRRGSHARTRRGSHARGRRAVAVREHTLVSVSAPATGVEKPARRRRSPALRARRRRRIRRPIALAPAVAVALAVAVAVARLVLRHHASNLFHRRVDAGPRAGDDDASIPVVVFAAIDARDLNRRTRAVLKLFHRGGRDADDVPSDVRADFQAPRLFARRGAALVPERVAAVVVVARGRPRSVAFGEAPAEAPRR